MVRLGEPVDQRHEGGLAVRSGLAEGRLELFPHRQHSDADHRNGRIGGKILGVLLYDANSIAAGGAVEFALLAAHLALTNADFFVV
jgi:hypothetical protein